MTGFGHDPVPGMDEWNGSETAVDEKRKPLALLVRNGPGAGRRLGIPAADSLIGRSDPPDVSVDIDVTDLELGTTPMVSRRHARLVRDEATEMVTVTDIGSTNGTWVDNIPLPKNGAPVALKCGTMLRLANLELDVVEAE